MAKKLMSHQATIFSVPDVGKAIEFYRDKMGFSLEFAWEEPPSYAVLQRDDAVNLHLSQSPNFENFRGLAYVFVHAVDEL
jgi:catechol 2,3-dioxygenase-like lactoylglutathione lyase family enzyme